MINHNNKRYWKEVRNHLISDGLNSEDATLLQFALDDDWLFAAMNYAPAGEHIAPAECAAIIVRNFLLIPRAKKGPKNGKIDMARKHSRMP
jgi:hypothetical protein